MSAALRTTTSISTTTGTTATTPIRGVWSIGIAAVVGIIAMLFIGFSAGPDRPQTQPTGIERTAPAPTAPTTQPVTVPK